jgi:hypothetical protein
MADPEALRRCEQWGRGFERMKRRSAMATMAAATLIDKRTRPSEISNERDREEHKRERHRE